LRTVFDGRHKFSRYFGPVDRNRPATLDDLYKANDVELFDLEANPGETVNLAADRDKNRELIEAMSAKLEAVIKAEIGVDDGREMPDISKVKWSWTRRTSDRSARFFGREVLRCGIWTVVTDLK
jgi:arylsulfatase